MKKQATISAEDLDKKFDAGEDISEYLDWSKARRPLLDQKRINVDLPQWMLNSLDLEARRVGVTRQSIVKMWLSERIKAELVAGADQTRCRSPGTTPPRFGKLKLKTE